MTKWLATFSGAKYHDTTARIVEDAPKFGVDKLLVYDDAWLRECRAGFCDRTSWFFNRANGKEGRPRGVNWFAWKPLVVLDAIRRIGPGDVLLYTDADTFPVRDLTPLYDQCVADGGAMLFGARGCMNGIWTKRDVFTLMGCDASKYRATWQTVARFMLFQKGGAFPVEEFLGQWLGFTCNPMVSTFEPSVLGLPDEPGFRENRVEQSVLSNLRIRYELPIYRELCEFGGWGNPPDLNHERDILGGPYFSQYGGHSFAPGVTGDSGQGSTFRNVND